MSDAAKLTPMMQQYFEVKDEIFSPVFARVKGKILRALMFVQTRRFRPTRV